jgi:hypothetical protein
MIAINPEMYEEKDKKKYLPLQDRARQLQKFYDPLGDPNNLEETVFNLSQRVHRFGDKARISFGKDLKNTHKSLSDQQFLLFNICCDRFNRINLTDKERGSLKMCLDVLYGIQVDLIKYFRFYGIN